jgi:hypothetical protein|tara:strand:- start:501 stop:605 length:105 start_codon:yes stop_codon:yes gene_type:complete
MAGCFDVDAPAKAIMESERIRREINGFVSVALEE